MSASEHHDVVVQVSVRIKADGAIWRGSLANQVRADPGERRDKRM
jgi:hypothetical protein